MRERLGAPEDIGTFLTRAQAAWRESAEKGGHAWNDAVALADVRAGLGDGGEDFRFMEAVLRLAAAAQATPAVVVGLPAGAVQVAVEGSAGPGPDEDCALVLGQGGLLRVRCARSEKVRGGSLLELTEVEDRRAFVRVPVIQPGRLVPSDRDEAVPLAVQVVDLSEGGACVMGRAAFMDGSRVRLDVTLEAGGTISAEARVVWVLDEGDGSHRAGLQFSGLVPRDRRRLLEVLRG